MSAARRLLDVLNVAPSGADDVDAADPPGTVSVALTRHSMFQSVLDVGITLRAAAEIADVAEGSIAARAGLRAGCYIFRVNGQHVETVEQVNTEFEKMLGVRIKALPMDDMEEILTKFHDADEDLDWGSLLETTPRYNFLSPAHPLHLRWQARLEDARRAKQALRQLELEGAQEDMALLQSLTAGPTQRASAIPSTTPPSAIGRPAATSAAEVPKGAPKSSAPAAIFSEGGAIVDEDEDVDEALMRMIVGEPKAAVPPPPDPTPIFAAPPVALLAFTAQPYTLSNGTVVTCVVKARKGEKPLPPVEDPPPHLLVPLKITASASDVGGSATSTSTAPRGSDKVRPQTLCKDFQRGRCHRSNCIYLHDDGSRRSRRGRDHRKHSREKKRYRSRSRERSDRKKRHR